MARMVWHDHGMRTQVTFDCADPHAQAAFWAAVFGSQVEDHSELVDQLVAAGRLPAEDMITIAGRSAFRDVAACSDPTGVEPRLFFQRVPEGKTSKNRVHLDVHVDEDRKTAEAERLVALGAQVVDENTDRGPRTIVMQDPEGNEFCLH
jgi:predicted enzyme related to lactoylglutathione lyase